MKPIIVNKKSLGKYAVAPYNFVSFPEKSVIKYNDPKELPAHNDFKSKNKTKLLNGYIEYSLKAETPIIVSSGIDNDKNARFFVNTSGKYAIPGSTIRGVIRTNSQILSFSNIVGEKGEKSKYDNSEIEDSRFLFRDIAGNNSLSKKYGDIMNIDQNRRISRNLRSGYIVKEGEEYYIEPAMVLSEGLPYIRVDELMLRKICDENVTGIQFMYDAKLLEDEKELRSLNKKVALNRRDRESQRKIRDILKGYSRENKGYKPYQLEISFEFDNEKGKAVKVGKKGKYKYRGYILSGGFILGKRSHYIVPEADTASERIKISQDTKEAYIDDLILTKKRLKTNKTMAKNKEFFGLPTKGERKPVFYIKARDVLHFGFTPYLRMLYSKSVLDGVSDKYKNVKGISYTEAMFGFTNKVIKNGNKYDKYDYKSRLSFDDAIVVGDPVVDDESTIKMILAEPKPTSYNLYLKQEQNADKKSLNIYENDFYIRGYKQYWLKEYIEQPDAKSENMSFLIHPLKEGTKFKGKIYFTNLDEEELGLLTWALKLNDNCYQNIGLAKPYGFGRVKVEDIELKIENLDTKYECFSFDYHETMDIDKYIDIYKNNFASKYLNGKSLDEQKPIKELMLIKSKVVKEEEANKFRYMEMRLKEFTDKKVLPIIHEYEKLQGSSLIKGEIHNNHIPQQNTHNKNIRKQNSNISNKNKESFANNTMKEAFKSAEKKKNIKK